MPWQFFSVMALFAMSAFVILTKVILNFKKLSIERYIFIIFIGLVIGCTGVLLVQTYMGSKVLSEAVSNPNLIWILLLGLAAGGFSALGNYFDSHAKRDCPNPGYAEAIKDVNTLFILAFSVIMARYFLGKEVAIFWQAIVGICLIPLGLFFLLSEKKQISPDAPTHGWKIQATVGMFCFAFMIMAIQLMQILGLNSPFLVLLIISLVVAAIYLFKMIRSGVKDQIPGKVWILFLFVIFASLVANASHYQALAMTKAKGYGGFAQAIFNSQTMVSFVLAFATSRAAPRFLSRKDGGDFSLRKGLGILIIFVSIVLIIFFTKK